MPPLVPRLSIPMVDKTAEQKLCGQYFEQARFMARQEAWDELGDLIRQFDNRRIRTPGGLPVAEVLASGARDDAVKAALAAVAQGDAAGASAPLEALTDALLDHPNDHGVAMVVAMAHIDVGWAWRGEGWRGDLPPHHLAAFQEHFAEASNIIDRFDAFELDAPSLAAIRCALLAAETDPGDRVADDYEDLIDLDPSSPRHMRAMGNHLLPRWFGNYAQLEREAKRTAERTSDVWGSGGYTWVYFDALAVDPRAFLGLDTDLFINGLQDIMETMPNAHVTNLMAAYTGMTMGNWCEPGTARAEVAACFDWIVRDHLREIHPLVWMSLPQSAGHRDDDREKGDPGRQGRVRALTTLTRHFAPEIEAGNRIVFDRGRMNVEPTS